MDNSHTGIVGIADKDSNVRVVDMDMVAGNNTGNMVDDNTDDIGIVVHNIADIDIEGMDIAAVVVVVELVLAVFENMSVSRTPPRLLQFSLVFRLTG